MPKLIVRVALQRLAFAHDEIKIELDPAEIPQRGDGTVDHRELETIAREVLYDKLISWDFEIGG